MNASPRAEAPLRAPSPSSVDYVLALFAQAVRAPLPEGFTDWFHCAPHALPGPRIDLPGLQLALTIEAGTPLAHAAARLGHLPADFDGWDFMDAQGQTVAYVAAAYGTLPAAFEALSIANRSGWTVAHELAAQGRLPAAFDGWHWKDAAGQRVIDVARAHREGGLVAQYEAWRRTQLVDRGLARPKRMV